MARQGTSRGQVLTAIALVAGAVALAAAITFAWLGADADGTPPVDTPAPTAPPTVSPSPTVAPSESPSGPATVDLDVADGHDVSVVVDDKSDSVADVSSGIAGDGMSVRWFDVKVENLDDRTIRVTWVGLPIDETVELAISRDGDAVALDFEQDAPPANSDALGFDRVLVIEFDAAVDADDVEVTFPKPLPA